MLFVFIFLGLVVFILFIAALLPKTYNIEKSQVIASPLSKVMEKVGDLNYYSKWNPWQQTETNPKVAITGEPMTPGHSYAWEGKKIGTGSLTLRGLDDKHLHFDLQFFKPWKSKAKDNWHFEHWGSQETKVIWQNSGELPWPMASLMGPIIRKNLDHQFEKGLLNLKKMCEG